MRVALNGFFWDQPRTGSGQYLRHLWAALARLVPEGPANGEPVFSMLLPPGSSIEEPVPTPSGFQVRQTTPLPVPGLQGKSANLDKLLWEQYGVGREAEHIGGLLHTPYLSAPLRKTAPTVVTAHDMIPWVVPGYRGSLFVQLYLRMSVAGVRRADLILADSEASRRDVIHVLKVPPHKVRTVLLGVERHPEYTQEELEEVRLRFGLPPAFAFYLGGFDRRKNVPLLLRAWREVVDMRDNDYEGEPPTLAIGGAAPEPGGVFPDVRGEAHKLGFQGEGLPVRFLGRVTEQDKPRLMAAARLFVYPSAYEGFGLDPLEAMSVGCPVVSSSGGSLKEVVGQAGILVPPNDEAALASAVIAVWRDEALRQTLGEAGRARSRQFTWERTAEQTLQLYREVGARRAVPLRTRTGA